MEETYFDISKPGSVGGVNNLAKYSKANVKDVKQWLKSQDTYTLHKPVRNNFRRRRVFTKGINDLWQADLVDLSSLARYNDNYRFILMCIDVFSKKAHAVPLKSKNANVVRDAFEAIIEEHGSKPEHLQTDKGTEFKNVIVQNYLTQQNIKFYTTENETIKAGVCERLNRTIKEKMFRYFTHKSTLRYVDILQDLMNSYNNTFHRSIKMAPNDVNTFNEHVVFRTLYKPKTLPRKFIFKVGDKVRISEARQPFQKGYLPHWTEEIFTIYKQHRTDPQTYEIKDYNGEVLKGKFYVEELQKVDKKDDIFKVEKVMRTRKRLGKTEYLVKWRGYPEKFNSWVETIL